jgi:hypothetical protein
MGSLQSGFVATLRGRLRFYDGWQHPAGHFRLARSKDPKLRGNANQEAHDTSLKEVPSRYIHRKEHPPSNVDLHQSTAKQREPSKIVTNL